MSHTAPDNQKIHNSVLSPQSSALSPQPSALSTQSSFLSPHHLLVDLSTDLLARGYRVRFRASGKSMHPTIREEEVITVEPMASSDVKVSDIIFYRADRGVIAHRVVSIGRTEQRGLSKEYAGLRDEGRAMSHTAPDNQKIHNSVLSPQSSSLRPQSSVLSPRSSILDFRSLSLRPQSSSLIPFFIVRGDAPDSSGEHVEAGQLLGRVVAVDRDGRIIDLASRRAKMLHAARLAAAKLKGWISSAVRSIGRPSMREVVR